MASFITRIIGNAVALYVAVLLVPGVFVSGSWVQYTLAGLILALLNLIVRPVLKLISFPLIMLTLGLFTAVINALILWILAFLLPSIIAFSGITALFWATIVVSIVNLMVSILTKII